MLIYSMSVSVDGFIADREGAIEWTAPDEELFRFHTALVRELGACLLGRRLYETMLVWETDPSLREDELGAAFADVWGAIPKVVFSRTLDSVQGNTRLAETSVAEEVAAALAATDKDVSIGLITPASRQRWMFALQGCETSTLKPASILESASSSSAIRVNSGSPPAFAANSGCSDGSS